MVNSDQFDKLVRVLSNKESSTSEATSNISDEYKCAIIDRHADFVKAARSKKGCSLLMILLSHGSSNCSPVVIRKLAELTCVDGGDYGGSDTDTGMNLMHVVAATDSIECLEMCLGGRGKKRAVELMINKGNKHGDSPLHFACAYGSEKVGVRMLEAVKEQGRTWDSLNGSGDGCLVLAARVGCEGLVRKLLEMEATCGEKNVVEGWKGGGGLGTF